MPLGLGTISRVFRGSEHAVHGQHEHSRALNSWGNSLGLKPEVGDPSAKYQHLLSQFENRYAALIDPPETLDPDSLVELEFEASESKQQQSLRAEFRKQTRSLLDDEVGEYKAVLEAQTGSEQKAQQVQDANIKYLQGNVQRSFTSAKSEAQFGGWLSAFRESANRSQDYVRFD